jgi:hypothetical protein
VTVRVGEIVARDGRYYADLLPAEAEVGTGVRRGRDAACLS